MNIPLSRLYNFLYYLSTESNIRFYRFYPHGSKKIEDLTELQDYNTDSIHDIFILCHDQEPLDWQLYSQGPNCTVNLRAVISVPGQKYNPVLLLHSEKRSSELEKYNTHRFIGVYYWSHAIIAGDWFRYAKVDPVLTQTKYVKKDFLIYNRAWSGTREYRLKFTELVVSNNLVANCNVKFNPQDDNKHYKDHVFVNSNLQIVNYDLENILELNTADATASADYNNIDYISTGIEVVLETLFDDNRLHLTEKSLRPIACGHPFILAAAPGSLEYLRSYGFKTFSGLIDESYDTVVDPIERLTAIVAEMKRIANLTSEQKQQLYNSLNTIATFNKQRFFSNDFTNQVLNEYKLNLEQGLQIRKDFNAKFHSNQTQ